MKKLTFSLIAILLLTMTSLSSISFASEWCSNQKSAELWYNSSRTLGVGETPWVTWGWSSMVCCVNGTDMDQCNKSLENDECAPRVVRGICMPIPE